MLDLLRWLVLLIWFGWVVIYWWGGVAILLTIWESIQASTTRYDTPILLLILGLGQFFVGTGVVVAQGIVPVMAWADNMVVAGIGAALTLIGAVGSTYCRYMMGSLWTAATNLHGDHQIIDTGLWGIIRHPLYAFIFLFYLGTALVFATWWEWLIFALMVAAHIKKLLDEERFLAAHLPGYRDYQQRVRYRIVPGVW